MRIVMILALLIGSLSATSIPKSVLVTTNGEEVDPDSKVVYSITIVHKLIPDGKKFDEGVTYCGQHRIEIYDESNDIRTVVWHELMHAMTDCNDSKVEMHASIYDLSYKIRMMLKDNPKMRKYLGAK